MFIHVIQMAEFTFFYKAKYILLFKYLIHFTLIFVHVVDRGPVLSSVCGCFPNAIYWSDYSFLCILGQKLTIYTYVYFWTLYPVQLTYVCFKY